MRIISGSSRAHRFLGYFAAFFLTACLIGGTSRVGTWVAGVLSCRQLSDLDYFLAYCGHPEFGDYEHGAYYFGLEPRALDRLRRADVLFLGNSRAQFAFSTEALVSYFRSRAISYYLLGFGYVEAGGFPQAIIRKQRVTPKVLVIVADPFFDGFWSPPAVAVAGNNPPWRRLWVYQDYLLKKIFTRLQPSLCAVVTICSNMHGALYRSFDDGRWWWRDTFLGFDGPEQLIANLPVQQLYPREAAASSRVFAEQFVKTAGVTANCVVLTVVPSPVINANDYAQDLGRLMGWSVVFPHVEGLTTRDGNHLSADSAERWSAALLKEIGPQIEHCVAAGG